MKLLQFPSRKVIRLRREDENSHILIVGDTGTGKSQLILQILSYIESIGDMAVVLDSQCEFIPIFYKPERGDMILNPKDERCPYWNIFDEPTDEADAVAVSMSLFPEPLSQLTRFFYNGKIDLFSFLLTNGRLPNGNRPTTETMGMWLAHPHMIDAQVAGTELETTISENSPAQRAGFFAELNEAARPLRMMPTDPAGRPEFNARRFAANPTGWLFLSNSQATRAALKPLQSMWMDMLIMRRLSLGKTDVRLWFVIDEAASLQTLPQMESAITEGRKTQNPIVLGMQNIAQLEDNYGKKSETIFSQAYTKLIGATTEPRTAKALQDLIGDVEYEKVRETRSGSLLGMRDRNSYSGPEDVRKPLVMASEIQGQENLNWYMVQRGTVIQMRVPYIKYHRNHPGYIERVIPRHVIAPRATPQPPQPKPPAPPKPPAKPQPQQAQGPQLVLPELIKGVN